jgi:hypothetical protein
MVSLQAISRLQIASILPPGGQLSFADIAKLTGLSERTTRRLLRHAMTMHVFCEPRPGMVAHTKTSKLLAIPDMNNWMSTGSEEMWPAATKVSLVSLWLASMNRC